MRTSDTRSAIVPASRTPIVVDDDLVWLVPVKELDPARSRPPSAAGLRELRAAFLRELAATGGHPTDRLVDAAARVIAACLADLPELPFIGEPFGGQEGTD